ncbi:dihydroorotate dehydrogenase-like protein [uncultured Rhodoblastus sp.]|uniref:dihydroorotate dehydrogenase-like protein n=1 Tax=uncultured Rhodoblastus sp. TaxID=543037 RepID=UPI0025FC4BA1|nr:dihydroorotate dehydrogenase-like protein [uncultured Rhodoblastus sp.]
MDLSTSYLGLPLRNPVIASASPLSADLGGIRRLEDCGAAAVVLPSLFEEQLRREQALAERMIDIGADSSPETGSYFPAVSDPRSGAAAYLDLIARARAAVDIPVIASLNGSTLSGWIDTATQIEQAGASAIELNIYRIASGPTVKIGDPVAECIALVKAVRAKTRLPLAVKLHPYYSAFGAFAESLDDAGADGLVLFNRLYQPDIDLASLCWNNDITLSAPNEIRLGLLWISLLGTRLPRASIAANTGVDKVDEIIKYLLAGADAVMVASVLLRKGPEHLKTLLAELETWLNRRGFGSVSAIKGLMKHQAAGAEAQERGDYISGLLSYRGKR